MSLPRELADIEKHQSHRGLHSSLTILEPEPRAQSPEPRCDEKFVWIEQRQIGRDPRRYIKGVDRICSVERSSFLYTLPRPKASHFPIPILRKKMAFTDGMIQPAPHMPMIIALSLAALITWRLWRFTVVPYLFPREPKVLPYWIPGPWLVALSRIVYRLTFDLVIGKRTTIPQDSR